MVSATVDSARGNVAGTAATNGDEGQIGRQWASILCNVSCECLTDDCRNRATAPARDCLDLSLQGLVDTDRRSAHARMLAHATLIASS